MPASQLVFHRLAAREFRLARDWYRARSEDAAERFRQAVDTSVNRLVANPEAFPKAVREYRWIRVARFPYVLIFRLQAVNRIMLVAVAHTSRRPGYWRRRV